MRNMEGKMRNAICGKLGKLGESQCMWVRTTSRIACGRIVIAVHAGKRGGVISRYASHC